MEESIRDNACFPVSPAKCVVSGFIVSENCHLRILGKSRHMSRLCVQLLVFFKYQLWERTGMGGEYLTKILVEGWMSQDVA